MQQRFFLTSHGEFQRDGGLLSGRSAKCNTKDVLIETVQQDVHFQELMVCMCGRKALRGGGSLLTNNVIGRNLQNFAELCGINSLHSNWLNCSPKSRQMSQTWVNEGSAEGCPFNTMEASEVEELYVVHTNQCSLIILFEVQCLCQILEAKDREIQRLTAAFEEA